MFKLFNKLFVKQEIPKTENSFHAKKKVTSKDKSNYIQFVFEMLR